MSQPTSTRSRKDDTVVISTDEADEVLRRDRIGASSSGDTEDEDN